jgi:predicted enzyme related to lactoylglutathione lyase
MDWKLELLVVPVTDIDRAKAFYADQLGFNVDVDHQPNDDVRIVQLTPPGSACSITIGKGMGMSKAVPGTFEGMQLSVHDIDAARDELVLRGVDVTPVRRVGENGWEDGKGGDYNSFFFFSDPDGNGWAVQQSPLVTG